LAEPCALHPPNIFEQNKTIGEIACGDAEKGSAIARLELNDDAERYWRGSLEERTCSWPENAQIAASPVFQDTEHQTEGAVRKEFHSMRFARDWYVDPHVGDEPGQRQMDSLHHSVLSRASKTFSSPPWAQLGMSVLSNRLRKETAYALPRR
jgi:hypothetical protein